MRYILFFLIFFSWHFQASAAVNLTKLVEKIQPAVVMITTYNINSEVAGIGSGFFIDRTGHLITNVHVLNGAYSAEVKMHTGEKYPIVSVVAQDETSDILKVLVDTGGSEVTYVHVADQAPAIAERVVVVGSPLGLDQTVSEGIVSAIRKMPGIGSFYQISAPISPGSSGSPVINMKGDVVGVATFQTAIGQNLNFAVSSAAVLNLAEDKKRKTLSEWTYARSEDKPRLAAELCRIGFHFSVQGEDKKALQYYQEATRKDPSDPMTWYGLGYCYAGLNKPAEAIKAYRQAVQNNPDDALAHYNLASYYDEIGRNEEAIESYWEVIRINSQFRQAYFRLGMVYTRIGKLNEGKETFVHLTRIDPDNASAHFFVGITSGRLGQYEEAVGAQQQVIRINPSYAPAHYNLGILYGKLGKPDEELAAYKHAIRVNPDYAPAHYKIGQSYLIDDNRHAALAEYKILMKLDREMAERLFDQIYD